MMVRLDCPMKVHPIFIFINVNVFLGFLFREASGPSTRTFRVLAQDDGSRGIKEGIQFGVWRKRNRVHTKCLAHSH